jgi:uncharacterized protein involved in cysteine biosynthesis
MKKEIENKKEKIASTQGGFLELIIFIIIALLLMKYFGITISSVVNWFESFFRSVLR